MKKDRKIYVCSSCLTAACWYGEFMCEKAGNAGIKLMKISELEKLDRENKCYWSDKKLLEVYGSLDVA